jgi:hypothetical protein
MQYKARVYQCGVCAQENERSKLPKGEVVRIPLNLGFETGK